ncbi:MAG: DUF371 domain-containing protein [Candidatus Bathyarchaeota archaeon]|nr:DUF371 domain-containing protein [Candidatus Bathyarchaeota archaeon]
MCGSEEREVITCYGHQNIHATHKTTLEFTRDKHLTKRGDCIVAVAADKALADLGSGFKETLRRPNAKLTILIEVDGVTEQVTASGSPRLILTHASDMVVRKSDFVCSRTLAVQADKAACDLSRALIEKLKNPQQKVHITLIAYAPK